MEMWKWVFVPALLILFPNDLGKMEWLLTRQWSMIGGFVVLIGVAYQLERDNRLESSIGYANTLALLLVIAILGAAIHYARRFRVFDLLLIAINTMGLLLTFSRSMWVLWGAMLPDSVPNLIKLGYRIIKATLTI